MDCLNRLVSWCLMLGFALLMPISLPAGGGSSIGSSVRIKKCEYGQLILLKNSLLKMSPLQESISLRKLPLGTPLKLVRIMRNFDGSGSSWLYVKVVTKEGLFESVLPQRGWLNA